MNSPYQCRNQHLRPYYQEGNELGGGSDTLPSTGITRTSDHCGQYCERVPTMGFEVFCKKGVSLYHFIFSPLST